MRTLCLILLLGSFVAPLALAQDAPVVTHREADLWGDHTILYDLQTTKLYPEYLVGEWCSFPEPMDGSAQYHQFHPDGSYNYRFLRMPIFIDPRISMNGTWSIVDNKVHLNLTTFTYIDGIESISPGTAGFHQSKGGRFKSVPIDPPLEVTHELYDLHYTRWEDVWEYPMLDRDYDYTKNLTATFSGTKFYKLYHETYEDIYPITAEQILGTWADSPPWSGEEANAFWTFREGGACERTEAGQVAVRASWRLDYGVLVIAFEAPQDGREGKTITGLQYDYEGIARNDVLDPGVLVIEMASLDRYWKVGSNAP